jgi:formylglycine-generating enzyme required for sulfatase activity
VANPAIRIFISSPSDVRPERLKAEQIVARLNREFAYRFHVEAVLWEREPLVATHHFQDEQNIPRPRNADIVVVILWSRLGVPLPEASFRGALSGRAVTGTEWEFEDALAGARERGVPDLLLYRKQTRATAELTDRKAVEERLAQLDLVEQFMGRWFRTDDQQSYTAASHSFASAAEFEEQLYTHLFALLERRAGARTEDVAIRWHQAPFRGLLSFDYEHAQVFFGRTRARNEVRELLARQEERGSAFVLVLGASGSGKSSLVKAGVLPDLMLPGMIGAVALVRWAQLRPSDRPSDLVGALAAALLESTALPELARRHYPHAELTRLLREAPAHTTPPLRQALDDAGDQAGLAEHAQARVTIIVDQLEELFTLDGVDAAERDAFVAALDALARSGLAWILATMRSDFYHRLEGFPMLARLATDDACYRLPPPDGAELVHIIRNPALEAGLRFEADPRGGVSLDEVIRLAATKDAGTLPLLSFVLDQLWQRRTERGELTFDAYNDLGGLEGALSRRAEEIFTAVPDAVQAALPRVVRALVSVGQGPQAAAAARPARLHDFASDGAEHKLIEAFLAPEARLLVADGAQIRVAHEALLSRWPRAQAQVAADARDLELRERLEHEAERWRAAPRKDKNRRVATGLLLAEGRELVKRWGDELPPPVVEFVTASRRAARNRTLKLIGTVAGIVIGIPIIAGLIWAAMVWHGVRTVEAEMQFVSVPSGFFKMGSAKPDDKKIEDDTTPYEDEHFVREVHVKAFSLGKYELSQRHWRLVMVHNAHPSRERNDALPVDSISWHDAKAFLTLMSWFGRHQYRLPTEAEWEYAARGGRATPWYWGTRVADACRFANLADATFLRNQQKGTPPPCDDGQFLSAPGGSYAPNDFGLHDMLGNVSEHVEDCYVKSYESAPTDGSAVIKKDCEKRVYRGGSYYDVPRNVRVSERADAAPGARLDKFGMRVVRK